jgi:hypothetical protein
MALPSWDMHLQHLRRAKGTQANSNETELSLRYISVAQSYADNSPLCLYSTKYPGEREVHGQGGFNYCPRILPPHATGLHTGSRHLMMTLKYLAPYMLTRPGGLGQSQRRVLDRVGVELAGRSLAVGPQPPTPFPIPFPCIPGIGIPSSALEEGDS